MNTRQHLAGLVLSQGENSAGGVFVCLSLSLSLSLSASLSLCLSLSLSFLPRFLSHVCVYMYTNGQNDPTCVCMTAGWHRRPSCISIKPSLVNPVHPICTHVRTHARRKYPPTQHVGNKRAEGTVMYRHRYNVLYVYHVCVLARSTMHLLPPPSRTSTQTRTSVSKVHAHRALYSEWSMGARPSSS